MGRKKIAYRAAKRFYSLVGFSANVNRHSEAGKRAGLIFSGREVAFSVSLGYTLYQDSRVLLRGMAGSRRQGGGGFSVLVLSLAGALARRLLCL